MFFGDPVLAVCRDDEGKGALFRPKHSSPHPCCFEKREKSLPHSGQGRTARFKQATDCSRHFVQRNGLAVSAHGVPQVARTFHEDG